MVIHWSYGGSRVGLMGAVAASTLAAGGKVIGVEPRFFIEQELQLDGLTELIVTEDMTDRKTKMIELETRSSPFRAVRARSRRLPR